MEEQNLHTEIENMLESALPQMQQRLGEMWEENKQILGGRDKQMKNNFYKTGEIVWSEEHQKLFYFHGVNLKKHKTILLSLDSKEVVEVNHNVMKKLTESKLDKLSEQYREYLKYNVKVYESNKKGSESKHKKSNLTGLDHAFAQVRKWHRKFNNPVADAPQALEKERAFNRTVWTAEELLEYLYATVGGNLDEFDDISARFIARLQDNVQKIKTKRPVIDDVLVGQVDALTDAEYFLKGTWTETGVYPQEMFDIVQAANMGKIFPDGSVHYDQYGKIIKPDNWEKDFVPEPKLRKAIQGQIERATAKQQK